MGLRDLFRRSEGVVRVDRSGPTAPTPPAVDSWPVTPTATLDVGVELAGESNYMDALDAVCAAAGDPQSLDVVVVLAADPGNPYDDQAVAAFIEGRHVGFLARSDAAQLGGWVRASSTSGPCAVRAEVRGRPGWWAVLLEPGKLAPFSLAGIQNALAAAGFPVARGDVGAAIQRDESRFMVWWMRGDASWQTANDQVTAMAKALRDAGYKARVSRQGDYKTFVSVTAHDG